MSSFSSYYYNVLPTNFTLKFIVQFWLFGVDFKMFKVEDENFAVPPKERKKERKNKRCASEKLFARWAYLANLIHHVSTMLSCFVFTFFGNREVHSLYTVKHVSRISAIFRQEIKINDSRTNVKGSTKFTRWTDIRQPLI